MRTVIVVQARMTSTRLPGKVLKEISSKPLLFYTMERLHAIPRIDEILIATTTNKTDDVLVEYAHKSGIRTFRGSESDVLDRFTRAVREVKADIVVRINSDCPLIDPSHSAEIIHGFQNTLDTYDYASNILKATFPVGLHTEIFTISALECAWKSAQDPYEREHVTPYIYRNPEKFRLHSIESPVPLGHYRWVVDTPADFEHVSKIIDALYSQNPLFGHEQIIELERSWKLGEKH